MRGAVSPLSNTPSWHGAQLKEKKHRDIFTYTFKSLTKYEEDSCTCIHT